MRLLAGLALGFIGLTAGALFEDTSSAPDLRPHEFRSLIKDNIVVLADFYAVCKQQPQFFNFTNAHMLTAK